MPPNKTPATKPRKSPSPASPAPRPALLADGTKPRKVRPRAPTSPVATAKPASSRPGITLADIEAHERDRAQRERELLAAIKQNLPALEDLLRRASGDREDLVYRFYHQSWKVYFLQSHTEEIVAALRALTPERPLNKWFSRIVTEGTGKAFKPDHNERWLCPFGKTA